MGFMQYKYTSIHFSFVDSFLRHFCWNESTTFQVLSKCIIQWCIDTCMERTWQSPFDVWPSTDFDNQFLETKPVSMSGATFVI